ncbi:MAG: hypothetical protein V3W44_01305 [Dehalococcoidales bacterium]
MIKISTKQLKAKSRYPLESEEQKAAWKWMATHPVGGHYTQRDGTLVIPTLQDYSYMVPNGTQLAGGGQRRAIYMANLKAQGLRPGVSDLVIAYPIWGEIAGRCIWPGAYIEMKRVREAYPGPAARKLAVREEQKEWLTLMDSVGYWTAIAYGAEEFKVLVKSYLNKESPPVLDFER